MTIYLVFRVLGSSLEFQSRVSAKTSKKAVQKLTDQQSNPPELKPAKTDSGSHYVAIAKSNFNKYKAVR